MNYTKKQGVSFCLVLAFSGSIGFAGLQQAVLDVKHVQKVEHAQKITSPKIADWKTIIEFNPAIKPEMVKAFESALQLNTALEKTIKTTKELSARDKEQVKQYVKAILMPVRAFFTLVKNKSIVIKPLLEDFLTTKTSLLGKFFEAQDDEIFFDNEVTSKALLQQLCKEYVTFFNALDASFTPREPKEQKDAEAKAKKDKEERERVDKAKQEERTRKEKAEKLTSPKMAVLNTVMEFKPVVMLEMFKTFERAQQLNAAIEKSPKMTKEPSSRDKDQIKQYLKAVLMPVRDFFTIVKDKGNLVKPLLEESLKTKTSLLGKFFEAKNDEVFFDSEVTTKELLQQACQEYITFFNCLELSLTPVAMTKYQQEKIKLFAARDKAELDKKSKK